MNIMIDEKFSINIPKGYSKVRNRSKNKGASDVLGLQKMTANSNALVLVYKISPKDAMKFGNKRSVIDQIHDEIEDGQGIIEVKSGSTKAGHRYIYSITKMAKNPVGTLYFLKLDIEYSKDEVYQVRGVFDEIGLPGIRHDFGIQMAAHSGKIGYGKKGRYCWEEDPYDPDFSRGSLMDLSESENMDEMFKDNPLSQAREFVSEIVNAEASDAVETLKTFPYLGTIADYKCGFFAPKKSKEVFYDLCKACDEYEKVSADAEDALNCLYEIRNEASVEVHKLCIWLSGFTNIPEDIDGRIRDFKKNLNIFDEKRNLPKNSLKNATDLAFSSLPTPSISPMLAILSSLGKELAVSISTAFETKKIETSWNRFNDDDEPMTAAINWLGSAALIAEDASVSRNAVYALSDTLPYALSRGVLIFTEGRGIGINKKFRDSTDKAEDDLRALRARNDKMKYYISEADRLKDEINSQLCVAQDIAANIMQGNFMELPEEGKLAIRKVCDAAERLSENISSHLN